MTPEVTKRTFFRGLGFRLSVLVGLAFAVGLTLQIYFSMSHHERALLNLKQEEARLLADTIEHSLTHSMRQGEEGRAEIAKVVKEVATPTEVSLVRLFDSEGRIQYSSDPTEMGRQVGKEARHCRQCHSTDQPLGPDSLKEGDLSFYDASEPDGTGGRLLGVINPIRNDPSKKCDACHGEKTVLGVLDVVVSLENLDEDISGQRSRLIWSGVAGVGAVVLVVALIIHFTMGRPVRRLVKGVRRMGDPALPYRMPEERKDELGNLAHAFNDMTDRLGNAQRSLREFADSLEDAVKEKTAELEDTQKQMFRAEKMAAIGQMAAGVAHEINNPLTGVITFAHLLLRKADPGSRDVEDLTTIIEEAERCSKIVRGLLDFARGGQLVRTDVDVNRVLDRIFSLVEHQATFHNIEIVRDYDEELPYFGLDQDRVEQVLLNLIMNAAEAMPSGGRLTASTRVLRRPGEDQRKVRIEIRDTGEGIDPAIRDRIFDPFFTTRPAGRGTGLGLSVSFRIIEDHGGTIAVTSEPGAGSCFAVTLPALDREENS